MREIANKSNRWARRYQPSLERLEDRLSPTVTPLAAPTIISITPVNATDATVQWSSVANETGYSVLLWNGTKGVVVATVGANVTSTTVKGLPGGMDWLEVEASNATSQAYSAWKSVSLPAIAVSGATTFQGTPASPTEIDLHWTTVLGQTGFQVIEWNGTAAVTIAKLPAGTHSYNVTGLTPGTTYYFSLQAYSGSASTTTPWIGASTPPQPITAPTNLTAKTADTQVSLQWTAATGATGYQVFEWENNQAVQVAQTDAHTTQATVTGLQLGTQYWFYVAAVNPSNSANTPWKLATTTAVSSPLLAPTNVKAVKANGSVNLTWTASAGAAGYWVYDWTAATQSWSIIANPSGTATSATLTGLKHGTHYLLVMAYTANVVQYASSKMVAITV